MVARKRARRKTKCVRFARDVAGDEGVEGGDHSEGSGDRVIPDPGIEPSPKWTKAEFLHKLLKGSGGVDEVLAALRREIDGPDDVRGVQTWVDALGRSVGTLPGILKPSALMIEGDGSPALDELLLGEDEWQDVLFEFALDSGSTDRVCDDLDASGYAMTPFPGKQTRPTLHDWERRSHPQPWPDAPEPRSGPGRHCEPDCEHLSGGQGHSTFDECRKDLRRRS